MRFGASKQFVATHSTSATQAGFAAHVVISAQQLSFKHVSQAGIIVCM
jgi:hypothetical protein